MAVAQAGATTTHRDNGLGEIAVSEQRPHAGDGLRGVRRR